MVYNWRAEINRLVMTIDQTAAKCGKITQTVLMQLVTIKGTPTLGTKYPLEVQVQANEGKGFRRGNETSEWCAPGQPWLELLLHSGFLPCIVNMVSSGLPAPEYLKPGKVLCNFTITCDTVISEDSLNAVEYTLVKEGLFNVIYSPDIITTGYLIPVELGELEIKKVLGTQTPNPITNFYMTQLDDESFAPFLPDET